MWRPALCRHAARRASVGPGAVNEGVKKGWATFNVLMPRKVELRPLRW
ncbi:hypothetical protein E2C01_098794 [Portunus trituberculatus]|uniref:Uncharacterized protein n=1 Tax=Portunus trituberculatus TaxID=210409 RepID=A0A5B7KDS1_PORTR|nr:hypothetical protein [Portunus trituberculatus]